MSFVGKAGMVIAHNSMLKWMDPLARKLGIVHFLHVLQTKSDKNAEEKCKAFQQYFDLHKQQFDQLDEMLEDDFSRRTMAGVLAFRKTWDMSFLKDIAVKPEYFQKDIFGPVKDEVFVDGGAYVGDTVESFVRQWGGSYRKIYAWEPDGKNLQQLRKNVTKYKNVIVVPCGMWEKKAELCFRERGGQDSTFITDDSSQEVAKVDVNCIDNVCAGDTVTFIKMDIEGCELAALKGAIHVIKRDMPRLAVCIYHKFSDLHEIAFWIKETVPEYKLYVRHHSMEDQTGTILYATL